ncbi:hypothetical protein BH11PAT4_BH11PAT4_6630 [soil metagenome]
MQPAPRKKPWLKVVLCLFLLILLIFGYSFVKGSGYGIDRSNLPQFIQADFIDLSKTYSVTQFRSGQGHDFSGAGETCRSMKHYYIPKYDAAADANMRVVDGKKLPALPDGKTDIAIYSPVDGKITGITEEQTPIGKQIRIVPDNAPQFAIRLFHVYIDESLTAGVMGIGGSKVKAGQKIGVIAKDQQTDISVQIGGSKLSDEYVSYFDVMPDSVFKAYLDRGAKSKSEFIITKEYRDAHPLTCGTGDERESFVAQPGYDPSTEEVKFTGYVARKGNDQGNGARDTNSSGDANSACAASVPAAQRPPGCK